MTHAGMLMNYGISFPSLLPRALSGLPLRLALVAEWPAGGEAAAHARGGQVRAGAGHCQGWGRLGVGSACLPPKACVLQRLELDFGVGGRE